MDPQSDNDPSAQYTLTNFGVLRFLGDEKQPHFAAEFQAISEYALFNCQIEVIYSLNDSGSYELVDIRPSGNYMYSVLSLPSDDLVNSFLSRVAGPDRILRETSAIQDTGYGECTVVYTVVDPGSDG